MTEQEMQELFRGMREEAVPADSLARVRARLDRSAASTSPAGKTKWWRLAVPVLVAGCLVAGFLILRPVNVAVPIEAPPRPESARVQPAPEIPVPTVVRAKRARPRRLPVEVVPVSIRIETPDPDVVILLVN